LGAGVPTPLSSSCNRLSPKTASPWRNVVRHFAFYNVEHRISYGAQVKMIIFVGERTKSNQRETTNAKPQMRNHSKSFLKLKQEQQKILDFAILICAAVPSLKKCIRGKNETITNYESLAKPDYFGGHVPETRLKAIAGHYTENLGKYIFLSSVSFFEAYLNALMEELLVFHGSKEKFLKSTLNRIKTKNNSVDSESLVHKSKLNEDFKKDKWEKYRKSINYLSNDPKYLNPGDYFSYYGLKVFIDKISNQGYKLSEFPDILENVFFIDLDETIIFDPFFKEETYKSIYHSIRDKRNKIAHGDNPGLGFKEALSYNNFLREFAILIDNKIVNKYFILERYN
jgi:PIN domain nuclease of toxin-antitoxin system